MLDLKYLINRHEVFITYVIYAKTTFFKFS